MIFSFSILKYSRDIYQEANKQTKTSQKRKKKVFVQIQSTATIEQNKNKKPPLIIHQYCIPE